jgi:hypothetical protein
LIQPENIRRKRASGGGSGAMTGACLRAGEVSTGFEIGALCEFSADPLSAEFSHTTGVWEEQALVVEPPGAPRSLT